MIRPTGKPGEYLLHLTSGEWEELQMVLNSEWATPPDYHRLSRSPAAETDPALREAEALRRELEAQHRQELQSWTARFLLRLEPPEQGQSALGRLTAEDLDHLLQVLNDTRVGAWMALGCPDPLPDWDDPEPGPNPACRLVMDLAGYFESRLIEALNPAGESDDSAAAPE